MDWKTVYVTARGALSRERFWLALAVWTGVGLAMAAAAPPVLLAMLPVMLFALVCLMSKRLHDMGRSGWWVALPFAAWGALAVASIVLNFLATGFCGMGACGPGWAIKGARYVGDLAPLALLATAGFLLWVGLSPGRREPDAAG